MGLTPAERATSASVTRPVDLGLAFVGFIGCGGYGKCLSGWHYVRTGQSYPNDSQPTPIVSIGAAGCGIVEKWWYGLSKDEQKVLNDAAKLSRDFERKDTREEAAKAVADLKAKGMQINELPRAEADRMRNKLTRVYAMIGAEVGMETWIETQNQLMKLRGQK